jgi:hypothetical protein
MQRDSLQCIDIDLDARIHHHPHERLTRPWGGRYVHLILAHVDC